MFCNSFDESFVRERRTFAGLYLEGGQKEQIEAVLTYKIEMPKLVAQEWSSMRPRRRSCPARFRCIRAGARRQGDVRAKSGTSADVLARLPAKGRRRNHVHVKYQATLRSRDLVPVKRGKTPPTMAPLADAIRQVLVETGGDSIGKPSRCRNGSVNINSGGVQAKATLTSPAACSCH